MSRDVLHAGAAQRVITPPVGVAMAGWDIRSTGDRILRSVHDDLYPKALVLRRGDRAWALLATDLVGIDAAATGEIREGIAGRTGLRPDAIMVTATHCHSGPVVCTVGSATAPEDRPRDASSVRAMLVAEGPTGPRLAGTRHILRAVANILERVASGEALVARPSGPMGTRKAWVGDLLREGAQRRGISVVEVVERGAFQAVQARLAAGESLLIITPHKLPLSGHVAEVEIPLRPLGVADIRRSLVLAAPKTPDPANMATRIHDLTGGLARLVASVLEDHIHEECLVLPKIVPLPANMEDFLADLDIDDLEVFGAIALAPVPLCSEEIEAVVQVPTEEALPRLLDRGMIAPVDRRYRLTADWFLQAVSPLLPDPEGLAQRISERIGASGRATSLQADLRSSIRQAEEALLGGQMGRGLAAARRAVALGQALGERALESEALLTLGDMQVRVGLLDEASRSLADATALAHAHDLDSVRRMCHGLRAWISLDRQPGARTAAASAIDRILPMIAGAEGRGHKPEDCLLFATWARAAAIIGDRRSWQHANSCALIWAEHAPEPLKLGIGLQLARGALALGDRDEARVRIRPALKAQDMPLIQWEAQRIQAILDGTTMPDPGGWADDLSTEELRALRRRSP